MDKVCKVGTFALAGILAACAAGADTTSPKSVDADDPLADMTQHLSPLATQ